MKTTAFRMIDSTNLEAVTGGGARNSASDDPNLQLMITQLGDSIKSLASNNKSSTDQMLPMMMMMMMGGGGGGGAAAAPPPPAPVQTPNIVRVNVRR